MKKAMNKFSYFGAVLICLFCLSNNIFGQTKSENSTALYLKTLKEAEAKSSEQKWDEAAVLWEKVVQLNPPLAKNWVDYANSLYQSKQYQKAITAYQKFNELGASYPADGIYSIASCYALLGDKEKALEYLEKAVNRGLRNLPEIQTDPDFESLRNDKKYRELVGLGDTIKMSREEGWRYDLAFLVREIKRMHLNPYRNITSTEFEAVVKKLNAEIPNLSDTQIIVGMMKLLKAAGDGHTFLRNVPAFKNKSLPIQFYYFKEGLYIIAAAPEQKDLLGAKILKIGDNSVEKTFDSLDSIVGQENKMWSKLRASGYLRNPWILNGLGLITDENKVSLNILDSQGKNRTVTLEGNSDQPTAQWTTVRQGLATPDPLYLKSRTKPYWFEFLPTQKTVYFQYNATTSDQNERFEDFCNRLFKFIDENDVSQLVIDTRWNGGGNLFTSRPLIQGLITNKKLKPKGKLFVIIGRNTFSAAMYAVAQISRFSNAIFVGEPTGSSPNFFGEIRPFTLPHSKIEGSVSDLFWQGTFANDYRVWIAPDIYAPPTFEFYKANRDPTMEAISDYLAEKAKVAKSSFKVLGKWSLEITVGSQNAVPNQITFSGDETSGTFIDKNGHTGVWELEGSKIIWKYTGVPNLINVFIGEIGADGKTMSGTNSGVWQKQDFKGTWKGALAQ